MPTTIQHIPDELITKALALTGKKIWDMEEHIDDGNGCYECGISTKSEFSMRVFCYYLLSPSFVKKYREECTETNDDWDVTEMIGTAIFEYQDGDVEPLNEVLSKI